MNKKFLALLPLLIASAACTRVDPGNVGVKVVNAGSNAGVQDKSLGVGWYWSMIGVDIYEYPIYTNTYAFKDQRVCSEDGTVCDGSNEELVFQDRNGLVVQSDITVSYRVDPIKAPKLFSSYRIDMDGMVAGPLRQKIQSALVASASTMSVEDIYGPKKSLLIADALKRVRTYFHPLGLQIDQLDYAGPIRIPPAILDRINARAQNEQAAIAAQATVATKEAESRAKVAEAQGDADSRLIAAEAEAKAIKIKGDALAQNPAMVAYTYATRWSGNMPNTVYCTSSLPCVSMGK